MITVRRANRIIQVSENEIDKYLAKGYEVISRPAQVEVEQPKPETKPQVVNTIKVAEDIQPKKQRKRRA